MKRLSYFATVAILMVVSVARSEEVPLEAIYGTAREGGRVIGLSYPNQESVDFLMRVLVALGVPYATKLEGGVVTVYWAPESQVQEQEVQNRVSQYDFIREVCTSLKSPLPSEPAKLELTCTK